MRSLILTALLALAIGSCSSDDGPAKDLSTDAIDGPMFDVKGADEPFGRVCTNIMQQCPEKHPTGFTLWCIALQGGTPGKGFCTPQCTDIGNECYSAPNGQWAQCFIADDKGDAGPGTKYCGFLCADGGKTWTCPGTLTCGQPNSQGTAVCLP